MLDARIVASSTQGLAPAAQSPATRTDWMVPSSHGLDLTLGTRDCSSRPNSNRTLTLSAFDRRSVVDVFQESCGWREKHIAGFGEAKIQQTIVVTGGSPDKHIFEHLLNGARRTRVADKIGAEFTLRDAPEGHVIAQDLYLFPILHDRCQRIMRRRRFQSVVEFNVRKLDTPYNALLRFGGQRIPASHIVKIFLNNHIAAARERGV